MRTPPRCYLLICLLALFLLTLSSCQAQPSSAQAEGLKIVATTSLVADVVSQVGGDKISIETLLPLGTDPHSFSPTPRQASQIYDADVIFANGAGLEGFLEPLLENIGGSNKVVDLSQGIDYLSITDEDSRTGELVDDPHTWTDPNNILIWVDNTVQALSSLDPGNSAYYLTNGQSYAVKLNDLDIWIHSQVSSLPPENRLLVTEHLVFGYFSNRYGFTQAGAIIPGFSSLAEPSAQDIAYIENTIRRMGVRAIFINMGESANLARRISDDTGTKLVQLYMHSLSQPGGEADNYIEFMRYNVSAIVNGLK